MFICEWCKCAKTCKRNHNRVNECSRFEEDINKHQEVIEKAKKARAKLYKIAPWLVELYALGGKSFKIEELENDKESI